jgi:serine/threonine protein phosphatase 1
MPEPALVQKVMLEDHLQWMKNLKTIHETEHFVFVHAGLVPGIAPEHTRLWERLWIRRMFIDSDYNWGKRVIFGHTVMKDGRPHVEFNKIGIDTMHHGQGRITAVILDEKRPGWYDIIQSKE